MVTYERSVTWTKVSLNEAKIRATPKTSSPKSPNQHPRPNVYRISSTFGGDCTHPPESEVRGRCSPPCVQPSFPWVPFRDVIAGWIRVGIWAFDLAADWVLLLSMLDLPKCHLGELLFWLGLAGVLCALKVLATSSHRLIQPQTLVSTITTTTRRQNY